MAGDEPHFLGAGFLVFELGCAVFSFLFCTSFMTLRSSPPSARLRRGALRAANCESRHALVLEKPEE